MKHITVVILGLLVSSFVIAQAATPSISESLNASANRQIQKHSPTETVKAYIYALYTNDTAAYRKWITSSPNANKLIGSQNITSDKHAQLRHDINAIKVSQATNITFEGKVVLDNSKPTPIGAKVSYAALFKNMSLVVPVVFTDAGWKVDGYYWLDFQKNYWPERQNILYKFLDRYTEELILTAILIGFGIVWLVFVCFGSGRIDVPKTDNKGERVPPGVNPVADAYWEQRRLEDVKTAETMMNKNMDNN